MDKKTTMLVIKLDKGLKDRCAIIAKKDARSLSSWVRLQLVKAAYPVK